jgi:hypothetical protein
MKAIHCREWGAPDVLRLEEAESPSLERHAFGSAPPASTSPTV